MASRFVSRAVSFPARWPYSPSDFTMDEGVDTNFYTFPRLVNHIDDNAIINLRRYYGQNIKPESSVLDIASSWVSHLPEDLKLSRVTGIGLNKTELEANPRLDGGKVVKDLNVDTSFPIEDGSVDAVICNVSIDYLTKPREVCLEAARVLRPGGTLHLAISNRCFPTKVIGRWLRMEEEERLEMVAAYMHFAAAEDGSRAVFKDIQIVEVVKPTWGADPLNVVRGTRI
ncbi:protein of unknown function [Taphrina deformans PYCC 5710]|uniref:Methyltransferase type 11 domain-containing protein n=1 Tax=Taphrina deformans (strain PYCC 5710 / ATCC 11124 / CBS 356.35 / IMI 108563 / JCM 9778 / NBRC 8474) TaxID=1097556 RepID=R4X6B2_TAPDE|nr:protein of unknown function [Taphrina deformans PYCC 5710]|eukprot:CCG80569.1 protein of unknown function [Taphrina deformans PYCC 5710]